jgi:alpha-D-ribose 1-methylphosphonate 5-triphosphate synthase subunit PhnG
MGLPNLSQSLHLNGIGARKTDVARMTEQPRTASDENRPEASGGPHAHAQERRLERFGVVSKSPGDAVRELWAKLAPDIRFSVLRGPEYGSVMLRGRVGGGGAAFNLGEATVTRASVQTETGAVGHFMTLGRDKEKARIGALIDAMAQDPEHETAIERAIIAPLRERLRLADERKRSEVAATKVDFFTMVRGED